MNFELAAFIEVVVVVEEEVLLILLLKCEEEVVGRKNFDVERRDCFVERRC